MGFLEAGVARKVEVKGLGLSFVQLCINGLLHVVSGTRGKMGEVAAFGRKRYKVPGLRGSK